MRDFSEEGSVPFEDQIQNGDDAEGMRRVGFLARRASKDVLFGNRHANRQGSRNPFLQPVHS
jgi:hypothetical protein